MTQLRGTVGAGLGHALGQVEGVSLEVTGMAVDPVLWAASPEAKRAAVDSFLDILPIPVPPVLRTGPRRRWPSATRRSPPRPPPG